MSEKNQTAVAWLFEKMQSELSEPMSAKFKDMFIIAKQKEREQIESAWYSGYDEEDRSTSSGHNFYNETYGK